MIIHFNLDENYISFNNSIPENFKNYKYKISPIKLINYLLFVKKINISTSENINNNFLKNSLTFYKLFFFFIISKNSIFLNNKKYKISFFI